MTPQLHYSPTANAFYLSIQKAIRQQETVTGQKPSLVQINRQDYQELTNRHNTLSHPGLSIDNVTVISFTDVEKGSFYFIPWIRLLSGSERPYVCSPTLRLPGSDSSLLPLYCGTAFENPVGNCLAVGAFLFPWAFLPDYSTTGRSLGAFHFQSSIAAWQPCKQKLPAMRKCPVLVLHVKKEELITIVNPLERLIWR